MTVNTERSGLFVDRLQPDTRIMQTANTVKDSKVSLVGTIYTVASRSAASVHLLGENRIDSFLVLPKSPFEIMAQSADGITLERRLTLIGEHPSNTYLVTWRIVPDNIDVPDLDRIGMPRPVMTFRHFREGLIGPLRSCDKIGSIGADTLMLRNSFAWAATLPDAQQIHEQYAEHIVDGNDHAVARGWLLHHVLDHADATDVRPTQEGLLP